MLHIAYSLFQGSRMTTILVFRAQLQLHLPVVHLWWISTLKSWTSTSQITDNELFNITKHSCHLQNTRSPSIPHCTQTMVTTIHMNLVTCSQTIRAIMVISLLPKIHGTLCQHPGWSNIRASDTYLRQSAVVTWSCPYQLTWADNLFWYCKLQIKALVQGIPRLYATCLIFTGIFLIKFISKHLLLVHINTFTFIALTNIHVSLLYTFSFLQPHEWLDQYHFSTIENI